MYLNTLVTINMQKLFLIIFGIIILTTNINAQYRINKTKFERYEIRHYSYQAGDPYKPLIAGLTSFILPGSGQLYSSEVPRGIGFLLLYGICWTAVSSHILSDALTLNSKDSARGIPIMGGIFAIGIGIWSAFDAVHVAKVNNLAFRENNNRTYNLDIQPYIITSGYQNGGKVPVGLNLKVSF